MTFSEAIPRLKLHTLLPTANDGNVRQQERCRRSIPTHTAATVPWSSRGTMMWVTYDELLVFTLKLAPINVAVRPVGGDILNGVLGRLQHLQETWAAGKTKTLSGSLPP